VNYRIRSRIVRREPLREFLPRCLVFILTHTTPYAAFCGCLEIFTIP
jgi:hypothetical protein